MPSIAGSKVRSEIAGGDHDVRNWKGIGKEEYLGSTRMNMPTADVEELELYSADGCWEIAVQLS